MKRLAAIFFLIYVLSGCVLEKNEGADIKVGDILPEFEVLMNDGSAVTDDYLKGSVSAVMFFHTSCPDCQQTLPRMQTIYDEYTSKGVKIVLISREEGEYDIMSYWTENGLNMPYSAQKDREVYELFATSRIPRIYISDEKGIVRYIYTDDPIPSYDELKSSLESLIR